jgi:hypothetical protein
MEAASSAPRDVVPAVISVTAAAGSLLTTTRTHQEALVPLPVMTPEQRADALAKAAEARQAQTAVLARVRSGQLPIGELLSGEDPAAGRIRVKRAILAIPGVGQAKAATALHEAGIQENRRVSGLTAGQRERLVAVLAG